MVKFTDFLAEAGPMSTKGGDGSRDTYYDEESVDSKLKAVVKSGQVQDKGQGFVIEDDDGFCVKVFVNNDQSGDFEERLGSLLNMQDEDVDQQDIAEIIFELGKSFDIIDVEWPTIEEDEEEFEDMPEEPIDGEMGGDEGLDDEEGDMDADMADAPLAGGGDDEVAGSALEKVIAMMAADAEARKTEAEARKAEAEAQLASISRNEIEREVKKQEEILDMEEHEKRIKNDERKKEQLAKLAMYRKKLKSGDLSESFTLKTFLTGFNHEDV